MLNQDFLRCPGGKAPRGYAVVGAVSSDLAEEFCLGHGWRVFYHNHAPLAECNFYGKLFSFKQQTAEFAEEARKQSCKEVKAWFPLCRRLFFCRVRLSSQLPLSGLPSFIPLNNSALCFPPCVSKERDWALVTLQVSGLISSPAKQSSATFSHCYGWFATKITACSDFLTGTTP